MGQIAPPSPTWDDVEATLTLFATPGAHPQMLAHLMRSLQEEAQMGTTSEFLQELCRSALILNRVGVSDIDHRQPVGSHASLSSS